MIYSSGQRGAVDYHLQATTPEYLDFTEKPTNTSSVNATFTPFFFQPVPVNVCDKTLLLSIRGIGPALADNIINTRKTIGFFKNKNDLLRVSGIGESRMNRFAESLSFTLTR
jgi:competence ComEA-like helix-hairpin-helix protein